MNWGPTPLVIQGIIRWVPPPSALPWVLLAAVVAVGVAVASRSTRWRRVLATAIAATVAVDVVHVVVAVVAASDSSVQVVIKVFVAGLVSVVAWVAGGVAAVLLERPTEDGLFLALFAALIIVFTGGLGDLPILGRSQIPYAASPVASRALVSLTFGLGLGVVAGGLHVLRRRDGAAKVTASPVTVDPRPSV